MGFDDWFYWEMLSKTGWSKLISKAIITVLHLVIPKRSLPTHQHSLPMSSGVLACSFNFTVYFSSSRVLISIPKAFATKFVSTA